MDMTSICHHFHAVNGTASCDEHCTLHSIISYISKILLTVLQGRKQPETEQLADIHMSITYLI